MLQQGCWMVQEVYHSKGSSAVRGSSMALLPLIIACTQRMNFASMSFDFRFSFCDLFDQSKCTPAIFDKEMCSVLDFLKYRYNGVTNTHYRGMTKWPQNSDKVAQGSSVHMGAKIPSGFDFWIFVFELEFHQATSAFILPECNVQRNVDGWVVHIAQPQS